MNVVANHLFPFLGLPDHIRLARCYKVLHSASSVPLPLTMLARGPWKKPVRLPLDTKDQWMWKLYPVEHVALINVTDAALHVSFVGNTLKHLDLSWCRSITDAGLRRLRELPALEHLSLRGCNKTTDTGLLYLAKLLSLKHLELCACELITDTGLQRLKSKCSSAVSV